MELLESPWFFSMVEKRASTPKQRLLAVFAITSEWIAAPGLREKFSPEAARSPNLGQNFQQLTNFLTRIATSAQAKNPALLANQLTLLLMGAIAEQLRHPEMQVLEEAAEAAQVLVFSACTPIRSRNFVVGTSLAATVLAAVLGFHLWAKPNAPSPTIAAYPTAMPVAITHVSPDEIAAVLALHEQIVRGECNAPQLAMLPAAQSTAYMNVIEFRQPDDPAADEANLRAFMAWFNTIHATECYPQHSNGHTSTVWLRKRAG